MGIKVAVIMDPLSKIKPNKDSTFALMLAMQARGWEVHVLGIGDLLWQHSAVQLQSQPVELHDRADAWFKLGTQQTLPALHFDAIMMRKDPPFDMDYIYTTYLLDTAVQQGALVVNAPSGIRAANEKLFTTWFPQCMPETLVTSQVARIKAFVAEHQHAIIKPLHGMGGQSIFQLKHNDPNTSVIIESMTQAAGGSSQQLVMLQKFIPAIMTSGDKRIIMIDGEPAAYALARIPATDDFRGNLAQGARAEGVALTERDHWLCQQVAPTLQAKGLWLVGLDVIGDYITEINVTSPTCLRELDRLYDLALAEKCIDALQKKINNKPAA